VNIPVQLPSGKILNIARFIALLPVSTTIDSSYNLILEGYSAPINLGPRDADALKKLLQLDTKTLVNTDRYEWNPEEQLHQNQRGIELLAKRIERHQNMSIPESLDRGQLFDDFKQTIDSQRLPGQKLYTDS
jgi:hypothetical protein